MLQFLTADENVDGWELPADPFMRFDLDAAVERIGIGKFERGDRPRDRVWASQLGGCPRAAWWLWRHPKPHDDEFSDKRGAIGHAIEDVVFEVWLRPFTIAREVSFTNHKVSGRADGFCRFEPNGPQVPVEVKSTYAFDWALSLPHKAHVAQALWYAQQADSPYALLLYVNLSNWNNGSGNRAALILPRADAWIDALTEKMWRIVHEDSAPPCEKPGVDTRTHKLNCFECSISGEHEGETY